VADATGSNPLGIGGGSPGFGQSGIPGVGSNTAVALDPSDWISGTGTNLPSGTTWSMEVWVYGNPSGNGSGGAGQIVGWGTGTSAGSKRQLIKFNGHIYFWGEGRDLDSGVAFPAAQWNHIVITRDGSGLLTIYLNGSSVASGSPSLTAPDQGVRMANNVGNSGVGAITATIDEVAIYNRALSASEVASHYNLGSGL